jgi:hypothetical protein
MRWAKLDDSIPIATTHVIDLQVELSLSTENKYVFSENFLTAIPPRGEFGSDQKNQSAN